MNWIKWTGPAVLLLTALSMAACQVTERSQGWNSDLDYYLKAVREDHYVYRSKELPPTFTRLAEDLRKNIDTYSDQRLLLEFERLAAQLGDGHTYILPWAAGRVSTQSLPVRFYLFEDGLHIIDAGDSYRHLVGYRVEKFGATSANAAMQRIADYVSRDNDEGIRWIGPVFLMLRAVQEMLGEQGDQATLTLVDRTGVTKVLRLPFGPVPRMRGIPKLIPSRITTNPPPLYLQHVDVNYWMQREAAIEKTLYVQFNQVMNGPDESLSAFSSRLRDSLNALRPSHLVIDVRHNNGGNAMLLDPLLAEMRRFKEQPDARITIITGRNTFSACQIFISRADALVHPVFAGERSSSKPNFVGEEHEVVLPYSGARGSISNRYHESIPGDRRSWIEVTLPIALTSADYFANNDPVLAKVLATR